MTRVLGYTQTNDPDMTYDYYNIMTTLTSISKRIRGYVTLTVFPQII
jgi:hypothetical protein